MIGAITGDIVGSIYEGGSAPPAGFPLLVSSSRFTDDTVMTLAVAHALRTATDYTSALQKWGRRYPDAGYGGWFYQWLFSDTPLPYNSFGNGSAMRVAAVGWAFDTLETVLEEAAHSAAVTHDHPEGIKGAQAVAAAIWAGRQGWDKVRIQSLLEEQFSYDCGIPLRELQVGGGFDISCQGTVPAAAAAFLASTDFEGAVRNAVSLGGDTDTLACIAGAIAEAHYGGVPAELQREILPRLAPPLREELFHFAAEYALPLVGLDKPEQRDWTH